MKQLTISSLDNPLHAEVEIPGSKSYTNRALILGALTQGKVLIKNPLFSDDTQAMLSCLNTLGIKSCVEDKNMVVEGWIGDVEDKEYILDADLSGTTIRFILALSCIVPGFKKVQGKEGLNKRPIGELVQGLRQLGAEIEYEEKEDFPPLIVRSSTLQPGVTKLKGDISSQYFSAIMMIAPIIGDVTIEVIGNQISKPYIDMTIDTMKEFGAEVANNNYKKYIIDNGQRYDRECYLVEGDFSGAGYFFAIAALTNSTLKVKNVNPNSKQADIKLLDVLKRMGSVITIADNEITIQGGGVKALNLDMEDFPDQVQTVAVLAAFADGVTTIKGVRSLRVKETERVVALEYELKKMGIKTESTHDTLTIYGGNPHKAAIDTYGDHRMAMSFAVAGTKLEGMIINNPEVVSKTFPEFWNELNKLKKIKHI